MKISRFAKSIVYMILALVLIAVSTYFQLLFHRAAGLGSAYFKSNAYLFIAAAAFIGTAVYSYRSYTKRHREHASDSLFLLLVGLVLMIAAVVAIVNFGGMGDTVEQSGYTAANVNIVLMSILPAPFFIRGIVLAFTKKEEKSGLRGAAIAFFAITAAAYVLSVALGGMMRMVYYDASSAPSSSSSSEMIDEKE